MDFFGKSPGYYLHVSDKSGRTSGKLAVEFYYRPVPAEKPFLMKWLKRLSSASAGVARITIESILRTKKEGSGPYLVVSIFPHMMVKPEDAHIFEYTALLRVSF